VRSSSKHIPVTTAGALTPITQNAPATPFVSAFFFFVSVVQLWCAEPVRNTGQPMTVPFHCSDDDIAQAGLTCSEDAPCPVYLDLTSVAALGAKIFLTGNLHAEPATLYSVLMESDDAGETWTEPLARIRGAGLDLIQFPDFEHGWISGEMLQPLARDPFFLRTSDGAKSWRQQPIFEDGTAGSIQSFWFQGATSGSLVLDKGTNGSARYQLFESPTGGDTWTIRESSEKPIRIRSMPPAGTGTWRVRADAKSHAFLIEKADGEHWKPLASFLISAGACKPGEPAEPPK
jgi:hypothetical protein